MADLNSDEKFDLNNTRLYRLSIQVTPDGFSFLISSGEGQIIASKNSPLKITGNNLLARHLKDWVQENDLLHHEFGSVQIFISEEQFKIIPDEFSNQILDSFFESETEGKSKITKNKVESLNAILQFCVDGELRKSILQIWPNAQIIHPVSEILEKAITGEPEILNTAILVRSKNVCFLVIRRKEKVILAQGFEASHENDLLYHLINIFQQLKVARSQTKLIIADAIQSHSATDKLLAPYFPVRGELSFDLEAENAFHCFLHF